MVRRIPGNKYWKPTGVVERYVFLWYDKIKEIALVGLGVFTPPVWS